ncbi:unnamed protein product [Didymodactylos carnosus]|uniref:Uncharacterized protein n=1 Tax=Didymodactylos carnosus TaxID=1234261 RepID=A0A814ICT7_9BILA|nr:unnamed protein product [Didymodactylos carnosus]CAF1022195.1 unnamed protein product [Didymodactylos carnosus]CAF3784698.1 unnamed protein product [Didymodactylos carnosus]CAF3793621.1 unnamed protein product [Didymodactylos carnosus]
MDHELISTVFRKYKKDYVSKYLQQWTEIGPMNQNAISPLNDCELKLSVSKFSDGYQFITYGKEYTIHLTLRLRGGMYHFTSGRQDFDKLPYCDSKAVKNVLAFNLKDIKRIHQLPVTELQNSVLQGQAVLSDLFNETKEFFETTSLFISQLY